MGAPGQTGHNCSSKIRLPGGNADGYVPYPILGMLIADGQPNHRFPLGLGPSYGSWVALFPIHSTALYSISHKHLFQVIIIAWGQAMSGQAAWTHCSLKPRLLTWVSNHMPIGVWGEITYPFPNFIGATVEFWEWICNLIPDFIMDVITYPC